jgi:photosystem II stability/assembly factor-like uncharacterized protein
MHRLTLNLLSAVLAPLLAAQLLMQTAVAATPAVPAAAAPARIPQQPLTEPAARVPHAAQAGLLASAQAGRRLVAVGERGVVMLSDDGGRSFRQARVVPVDVTLTSVSFADAQRGWAVGHWGTVLATTDGGETWLQQRQDVQVDRPLFAVHFFDAEHGVAVGLWSLVLVTADGGASWRSVTLAPPEGTKKADLNLLGLFADGQGRLYAAAERGMVLRSDDRGATWSYTATGYKGSFWTGLALPDGVLLVAGLRGSLYRSDDEGRRWQRVETASKSSITALAERAGVVTAVGLDGLVLRSSDRGASFTASLREDRAALTSVTMTGEGRTVLFSRQGAVQVQAAAGGKP